MTRRCSHCSHNGHNSRTCPNRGVKLFGVRLAIDHGSIRKSASMGNLTAQHMTGGAGNGCGSTAHQNGVVHDDYPSSAAAGYASEDFVAGSSSSNPERRKGVPWTEEEHRMFLLGLQKLGKGDWRGISRNYVITRTPTQVASHAQKYFIRQTNVSRRKRRSSLFDLVPRQSVDPPLLSRDLFSVNPPEVGKQSIPDSAMDEESESMESSNSRFPCVYPASYVAQIFSLPVPFWTSSDPVRDESHQIVKPKAVHSKTPFNVVEMSKLSLENEAAQLKLSLELVKGSSNRPSAFHANSSSAGNSIHVI